MTGTLVAGHGFPSRGASRDLAAVDEPAFARLCRWTSVRFVASPAFREKHNSAASAAMKNALRFVLPGIEPYQLVQAALFLAGVAFAVGLITVIGIIAAVPSLDPLLYPLLLALLLPLPPVAVLAWAARYPLARFERLKVQSLGWMPEVVNFLTMSMRLSPSLTRAVAFAAEHVGEPAASGLRKMLWDVYMRKHNSFEEAFLAFAYDWGSWSDDFKRSLYAVRGSEMERSREGLNRGLDKAVEIVLTGTRRRMETFVHSLSAPTFVLFALGILLPLILGAMLPMASIGGFQMGPLPVALLLAVLFPLATAAYAVRVAGRRPGFAPPQRIERARAGGGRRMWAASASIAILPLLLFLPGAQAALGPLAERVGYLPFLWSVSFPAAYILWYSTRETTALRREARRLDAEFPDALFQVGSRIAEGVPVEIAFERTASVMKATPVARLFMRIAHILHVTRLGLEEALFGPKGALRGVPSRTIGASMRMLSGAVKMDSSAAGQTIVGVSTHLREMARVEHEVRTQLATVMETMRSTAMIFGPIVLGITTALYFILGRVAGGMSGGGMSLPSATALPAPVFSLILGVYLIEVAVIISYYTTAIRDGADAEAWKAETARVLPAAVGLFSVAVLFGGSLMGA